MPTPAHPGPPLTLHDRFMALCMPEPNSGCWLWLGFMRNRKNNPHGVIWVDHATSHDTAHRVAWTLFKGDYKSIRGKHLHHTCGNYGCVNPSHLAIGSSRKGKPVASLVAYNKARAAARQAARTAPSLCEKLNSLHRKKAA